MPVQRQAWQGSQSTLSATAAPSAAARTGPQQHQPVTGATVPGSGSLSSSSCASSSSSTSSVASGTHISQIPAARWATFIRSDSKVSIDPVPADAVTACPPYNRGASKYQHQTGGSGTSDTTGRPNPSSSRVKHRGTSPASPSSQVVSYCCNVSVNLKGADFRDTDSGELIQHLEQRFFSKSPQCCDSRASDEAPSTTTPSCDLDTVYFVSLDLSENQLTCSGMKAIASWFIHHARYIRLRHLKVFKNAISDIGAAAVADLIMAQPSALEELHLSHNRITEVGAAALFKSFSHARRSEEGNKRKQRFVYPRPADGNSRGAFLPVWIRLEYNCISDAAAVLQRWEADCRALRGIDGSLKLACFADRPNLPRGSKDPHCSPARCLRATNGHSPLLHLYSFYHQSAPPPAISTTSRTKTWGGSSSGHSEARNRPSREVESPSHSSMGGKVKDRHQSGRRRTTAKQQTVVVAPTTPRDTAKYEESQQAETQTRSSPISSRRRWAGSDSSPSDDHHQGGVPQEEAWNSRRSAENRPSPLGESTIKTTQTEEGSSVPASVTQQQPSQRLELIDSAVVGIGKVQKKAAAPPATSKAGEVSNSVLSNLEMDRSSFTSPSVLTRPLNDYPQQGPVNAEINDAGGDVRKLQGMLHQNWLEPEDLAAPVANYGTSPSERSVDPSLTRGQHARGSIQGSESANAASAAPTSADNSSGVCTGPVPSFPTPPGECLPNLPLYVFLDASAFAEMRRLQKNNNVNLFSFPGMLALCEKRVLCYSSMRPIVRKKKGSDDVEKLDANQSLILMIVNSVEEGLLAMTETQPFLREALVNLHQDFIGHLAKVGVVESIEGLSDGLGARWMILDEDTCEKAKAIGAPIDALRVIDFAFVWAHHLAKVSGAASAENSDASGSTHPPAFALFVTSNPKVERFFGYLVQRQKASSGHANGSLNDQQSSQQYRFSSSNLLCMNLDRLNHLLRESFPHLASMLQGAGCFDSTDDPYMEGQEVVSASAVRRLVHDEISMLADTDLGFSLQATDSSLAPSVGAAAASRSNHLHERRGGSPPATNLPFAGSKQEPLLDTVADGRQPADSGSGDWFLLSRVANGITTTDGRGPVQRDGQQQANVQHVPSEISAASAVAESTIYRLQQENDRCRLHLQRAYSLLTEIVRLSDMKQHVNITEEFIRRCKTECAHCEGLLRSYGATTTVTRREDMYYTSQAPPPGLPVQSGASGPYYKAHSMTKPFGNHISPGFQQRPSAVSPDFPHHRGAGLVSYPGFDADSCLRESSKCQPDHLAGFPRFM